MKNLLFPLFCLFSFSFSKGENKFGIKLKDKFEMDDDTISAVLNFVRYLNNIKGLEEAIMGFNMITRKNLTNIERILSLISPVPSGNLLNNKKQLKNAQNFLKAAEKAKKSGKLKNFINLIKATIRENKKAIKVEKLVKKGIKIAKAAKGFLKKNSLIKN